MSEPNWEWYRSFLGVLDEGSLSAAARSLGLAQPTIGRHVDSLEAALGVKLFVRSYDGFSPTEAARELRPYAASLATTAAALQRVATGHGSGVRGSVRITASEIVGVEVLPPILAQLRHDHPSLAIELMLSNKVDDLLRREADIAVRMVQPRQEALVARRIGGVELGLHAHRRYLETAGVPDSLEALHGHTIIGFDEENELVRRLLGKFGSFSRADLALRANSDLAQLAALRAGFGIGVCQVGLARRSPDLVRLLPEAFSMTLETWLAMHEDLRESPRCAVTFAALAEGLASYIATAGAATAS